MKSLGQKRCTSKFSISARAPLLNTNHEVAPSQFGGKCPSHWVASLGSSSLILRIIIIMLGRTKDQRRRW